MAELSYAEVAQQLLPLIRTGRCIAWLGSGLSLPCGYPDWHKTIETLCTNCGVSLPEESPGKDDDLIGKAEDCKVADKATYHTTLGDLFGADKATTNAAYGPLMKLPFMAYVTTNYDPLLLNAGFDQGHIFYSYPSLPAHTVQSDSALYYMHGLAKIDGMPTGKNLVFSTSEFEAAYESMVRSFIEQILIYNPVIFIGCSLSEPDVKESFRRVRNIHRSIQKDSPLKLPERKILLSKIQSGDAEPVQLEIDAKAEAFQDSQYEELGIEVIRYVSSGADHPEIASILEALCTLEDPSRRQMPSSGLPEEPQP